MIKDLLIFFFSLDGVQLALFAPAVTVAFFAGVISFVRGVNR